MENTKSRSDRKCELCKAPLNRRLGQQFYSDQCQASHHNLRKMERKGDQLMRNRNILKQASPEGKTTVNKSVLERDGFDFRYFTNQYRTQKGNTYHFCYDFGYLQ